MKRKELMKQLSKIAHQQHTTLEMTEGSNHSKARIGSRTTTIPRHREINEHTAKAIIKFFKDNQ